MSTDRENEKNAAVLIEIDERLDSIIAIMDEHGSYYTSVISSVRDARGFVRSNPKKALSLVESALKDADEESVIAIEFERITGNIMPDDPVFKEKKVVSTIDDYNEALRKGKLKVARKCCRDLEDAIGNHGVSIPLQVSLEDPHVDSEDLTVRFLIKNTGSADVILNSAYANADVWTKELLLVKPVIRSGDVVQLPLVLDSKYMSSSVIHLQLNFTRDLVPVSQKYSFKIFVE